MKDERRISDRRKKDDLIRISSVYERLIHWALAGSFVLLFLTGMAVMFRGFGKVLAPFLGGFYALRAIHHGAGIVFVVALVLSVFMWAKEGLVFDRDDVRWFAVAGGYLWKVKNPPEQGYFNAGQKVFFVLIVVFGTLVSLSGFVIWFPDAFSRDVVRLSYLAHVLSVAIMSLGWLAHWYLGTLANPGGVHAITNGWVSRAYARKHKPKWYREYSSVVREE